MKAFPDRNAGSFSVQGKLVRVRGQNILFSPLLRAIFSLNDSAAEIWSALDSGMTADAVQSQIERRGDDSPEAGTHLRQALAEWERLGLIHPPAPSIAAASRGDVRRTVAIGGLRVRIVHPASRTFSALEIFRHLEVESGRADLVLTLVEHANAVHIFRSEGWVLSCPADALATALKGHLLSEVLERGTYELAVHAAALRRGGRALLVCGQPGAGKTTLTMALLAAGFAFAGDDVTLLDADGRAIGLPFAPAIKPGSWRMLSEGYPDLMRSPVFRRPDRRRVRYLTPTEIAPPSACPVAWVLLLRRRRGARARLKPVDAASALRGLLRGSYAPSGELTGAGFGATAKLIGAADVYSLTYSALDDAVGVVLQACR